MLLVDDNDNILMSRNFKMPEPVDSLTPDLLSDANRAFLAKRLKALKNKQPYPHQNRRSHNATHLL